MGKRRYSYDFFKIATRILTHFFLFLEINFIPLSKKAVCLWISEVCSSIEFNGKSQIARWFYEYITYGTIGKTDDFAPASSIESLPSWSREILNKCLALKRREGMEYTTLCLYQSSGIRLFSYLDRCGIKCCADITPELLINFHNHDKHKTIEGKNATSAKVRKILQFMAEENLIPYAHSFTIAKSASKTVRVTEILSEEMVKAIYEYRTNADEPIELRNAAMIMLGLRMGLRACDVVNFKLNDIDWKNQKIALIQKKTGVAITLPMPTEVANSIYKYITQARPHPLEGSEGFVFIKTFAPYVSVSTNTAIRALEMALDSKGLSLKKGQGFHILRNPKFRIDFVEPKQQHFIKTRFHLR